MQNNLKNLPWRNKIFSWGVIIACFGILGFFLHSFDTYPTLNDLDFYKGQVYEIENWHVKNITGVDVFLKVNNEIKRFNFGQCRTSSKKLNINDEIEIYIEEATNVSRVEGNIWQLVKSGQVLCDYTNTLSIEKSVDRGNLKLSYLSLIIGFLLAIYGYLKNKYKT